MRKLHTSVTNKSGSDNVVLASSDDQFNYVICVPGGSKVDLTSINGNLNSEVLIVNFTADLVSGNINIKNYSGDLKVNTLNGGIDILLKDSSVKAQTINGNIYADEGLEFTSKKRILGQQVQSRKGPGKNKSVLSTLYGNMCLRGNQ